MKDVIAGKDNKVRVVRLIPASGELVRPIERIFPLELKYSVSDIDIDKIVTDKYKSAYESPKTKFISDTDYEIDGSCNNGDNQHVTTKSGRKSIIPERLTYH